MQAEDAVQEALLDFWRCARTYDPAQGNARAWLLRIVTNKALKLNARSHRRQARISSELHAAAVATGSAESAEVIPERMEAVAALRILMGQLSAYDRRLLALYFSAGFTSTRSPRRCACRRAPSRNS